MPSSRKAAHAAAKQPPQKSVKQQRGQQQARTSSHGQTAGKSSSASSSASVDATTIVTPQLLKPKRPLRSVALTSVESLNTLPKATAAASLRAQLLRLATQEAHTAATLLRLLPSSAAPSVRDDAQPNRSPLRTPTPRAASSGAGATGGAVAQAGQTTRMARGRLHSPHPQPVPTATNEASSTPTQTLQWTSYGDLWEGLLARLPLASGDDAAAKLMPTTCGSSDHDGDTGGGKRRHGTPAGDERDSAAALPPTLPCEVAKDDTFRSPATHFSVMRGALNSDWRSFLLCRTLSASAANSAWGATPAAWCEAAAWAQRRRMEDLACSPYMTHAEQRAVRRYATAAVAAVPSDAPPGLSSVCALDFV